MKWRICVANCCAISCWLLIWTLSVALGQQLIIIIIIVVGVLVLLVLLVLMEVHVIRKCDEMHIICAVKGLNQHQWMRLPGT